MDNKKRWDAAVELFSSLNRGDKFDQPHADGSVTTWNVISGCFVEEQRILQVALGRLNTPTSWAIDKFCRLRCVASPEPEKSEAEKLFDTPLFGKPIWVDGAEWKVFGARQDGGERMSYKARCVSCQTCERDFTAADFDELNITATRPNTVQEMELESSVKELDESQSRVGFLEKQLAALQVSVNEDSLEKMQRIEDLAAQRNDDQSDVQSRIQELEHELTITMRLGGKQCAIVNSLESKIAIMTNKHAVDLVALGKAESRVKELEHAAIVEDARDLEESFRVRGKRIEELEVYVADLRANAVNDLVRNQADKERVKELEAGIGNVIDGFEQHVRVLAKTVGGK